MLSIPAADLRWVHGQEQELVARGQLAIWAVEGGAREAQGSEPSGDGGGGDSASAIRLTVAEAALDLPPDSQTLKVSRPLLPTRMTLAVLPPTTQSPCCPVAVRRWES